MAMTITLRRFDDWGDKYVREVTLGFDSSYAWGGKSLTARNLGLSEVSTILIEPSKGYSFEYDHTNAKIQAFAPAPPIVYNEKHTAVAGLITLDYPAAWIVNVCIAGATTPSKRWVKRMAQASLSTRQFCLVSAISDGAQTKLYVDGATDVVYVTYVTQAWHDLYKCLVQEEVLALTTGYVATTYDILAHGYLHDATTGILPPQSATTAAGAGLCRLTFGVKANSYGINIAQNGHAAVATYLKLPASGFLADRVITEVGTKTGLDPYLNTFTRPLLLWLQSGDMLLDNAAPKQIILENALPATGYVNVNWGYRGPDNAGTAMAAGFVVGGKDNVTANLCSYLTGHPWEIPGVKPLEVRPGVDLSSLSEVRALAIGV